MFRELNAFVIHLEVETLFIENISNNCLNQVLSSFQQNEQTSGWMLHHHLLCQALNTTYYSSRTGDRDV